MYDVILDQSVRAHLYNHLQAIVLNTNNLYTGYIGYKHSFSEQPC